MDRQTRVADSRTSAGFSRGGKLAPVMGVAFKGRWGGMVQQDIVVELAPVVGRLITPVTATVYAVWVPVQAMMAAKYPTDPVAGVTEVIRQKLLNKEVLFGLEPENDISKRMGVTPISIGGVLQVSETCRLAHNCAVNFLRKSLYTYASEVAITNAQVTPALLSRTVLEMFNGVLDPDDHVNGAVSLGLTIQATVPIIRRNGPAANVAQRNALIEMDASGAVIVENDVDTTGFSMTLPDGAVPMPVTFLNSEATGFSLTDLYNAETVDRLTRQMRDIIDANPIDGEEQVVRMAYGLEMDTGQNCVLMYSSTRVLGQDVMKAMDGAGIEAETTQSRLAGRMQFAVPVPRTELGGVLVTFLAVKPDEVLFEQPHPEFTTPWVADNLMAEELQLDPQPVLARQLQASVAPGDEATVCFYTGYNELRRSYVAYGWSRATDPADIDVQNTMWLYKVPASVSPENIVYPEDLPHYPFPDQDAEVVRYAASSVMRGLSPMYVGPSPVETVSVIDDDNLLPQDAAAQPLPA